MSKSVVVCIIPPVLYKAAWSQWILQIHNYIARCLQPISQIQFWSSTAPRGDRDSSNQPPDPMLAEKNAAMMVGIISESIISKIRMRIWRYIINLTFFLQGPGRLRRPVATRKLSTSQMGITINDTQSSVTENSDPNMQQSKEQPQQQRPAKRSGDHIRAPRINVQHHANSSKSRLWNFFQVRYRRTFLN